MTIGDKAHYRRLHKRDDDFHFRNRADAAMHTTELRGELVFADLSRTDRGAGHNGIYEFQSVHSVRDGGYTAFAHVILDNNSSKASLRLFMTPAGRFVVATGSYTLTIRYRGLRFTEVQAKSGDFDGARVVFLGLAMICSFMEYRM